MISTNHVQKNSIGILVSPGFTENEVVYCLSQMRALGLPVSLVGLSSGLVKSQRGLHIKPDLALSGLAEAAAFQMLIIPGSYECVTNLLVSPDFHTHVEKSIARGGRIAVLASGEAALHQVAPFVSPTEQILYQQEQTLEPFCQQLIQIATTL